MNTPKTKTVNNDYAIEAGREARFSNDFIKHDAITVKCYKRLRPDWC